MENNKGQTIFLSVIGIATLLVAIVGATFAWFSTTISGTGATANITTAQVSALSLKGTTITGTNVLPGWESDDATFTISGTVTGDVEVPYTCTITSNNVLTDLEYRVSDADAIDSTGGTWTEVGTSTQIVTGSITADNASDVFNIALRFPETGADQNLQQGQTATATVTCALAGGTIYYNTTNPTGTTTPPTAQ